VHKGRRSRSHSVLLFQIRIYSNENQKEFSPNENILLIIRALKCTTGTKNAFFSLIQIILFAVDLKNFRQA
jgi:hypothetical protein